MSVKAMVVDDNMDVRRVFIELLQLVNIEVIGVGSNGKEAVKIYQELHPDVVFMDVMMPEYDGFYGLENIKKHDPDAIVVLVTGSINVEEKLDNCSATAILPKPIEISKITSIVEKFCVH